MRKVLYLIVLCSLLMLPVFAGQATSLETRVGIDSSSNLSFAFQAEGDISSSMSIAFVVETSLVGIGATQTSSTSVGLRAKWYLASKDAQFVPYLGFGGHMKMEGTTTTYLVEAFVGGRVNVTPNIYLLGEGAIFWPVAAPADYYWKFYTGLGFAIDF